MLFMGTIEPRKNVGALLRAYAALLERRPERRRSSWPGALDAACQPLARRARRPPLAGHVRHLGYVEPATSASASIAGVDARAALARRRLRAAGARSDDDRRAGRRLHSRRAAGSGRATPGCSSSPTTPRDWPAAIERLLDDPALARDVLGRGHYAARAVSVGRAAPTRLIEAYASAIERRRARRDRDRCASASTPASCWATRPASAAIWPSCSRRWVGRSDARRRRFVLYAPSRCRLSCPPGAVDVRVVGAGAGRGHLVGADASAAARSAASALDVFFAPAYTAPLGLAVPLARHDPRHLVCRPSRVVSLRAKGCAAAGSRAAPRSAAARRLHRLAVLPVEIEAHLGVDAVAHRRDPTGRHRRAAAADARAARAREPMRALRRVAVQPPTAARTSSPPSRRRRRDLPRRAPRHRRRQPHLAAQDLRGRRGRARRRRSHRVSTLRRRRRARRRSTRAPRSSRFCPSTRASA